MATEFVFPTSAQLAEIEQDLLPRLEAARPIFQIMPIVTVEESLVIWEQLDNFTGLQQLRGVNGPPQRVQAVGVNRYMLEPGVYGEWMEIDELQLLRRRQLGTFGTPVALTDLVMERQAQLLQRRLDRIEQIGWDVLSGTFSVAGGQGIVHTDSYAVQTYNTTVAWSTHATSTPLADFRAVKLKARGHSVDFGAGAKAYANSVTINNLLQNGNADDLYGRRTAGLGTYNNLVGVNQLLLGDSLPQLVEYDLGYLDDTGTFTPFIPDGRVIVVGARPAGMPVAQYQMTRNVNNPGFAPGPHTAVITKELDSTGPVKVEVHDGHNGGPALKFATAIVKMDVTHNGA